MVRVFDRVRQVSIAQVCEQYASAVYKFAFLFDERLAYTKAEMGKYTGS